MYAVIPTLMWARLWLQPPDGFQILLTVLQATKWKQTMPPDFQLFPLVFMVYQQQKVVTSANLEIKHVSGRHLGQVLGLIVMFIQYIVILKY